MVGVVGVTDVVVSAGTYVISIPRFLAVSVSNQAMSLGLACVSHSMALIGRRS